MSATLPDFVTRWQGSTLTERSAAQSHFIELCQVLGQPTPASVDQTGASYTFEKGAAKADGGEGWADIWMRGHFAWEYKGKHKSLAAAYQQLNQYREALANPPLLVVCDLDRFEVHTNFTNTPARVCPFPWPLGTEPARDPRVEAIALGARELVAQRDAWLNPPWAMEADLKARTLTNLYNERPTWLDLAHRRLDRAVFDAYGWPHDLTDDEILARLVALNLERGAVPGAAVQGETLASGDVEGGG